MKVHPTLEQHLLSNPSQNRWLFFPLLHTLVAQLHTWIIGSVTLNVVAHRTLWGWAPARFPRPCFWRCRCTLPHPASPPPVMSSLSHLRWSCTSHPPPEQLHSCGNQTCKQKCSININFRCRRVNRGVRRISCSLGSTVSQYSQQQNLNQPGTS